jgi:hypothetical protein
MEHAPPGEIPDHLAAPRPRAPAKKLVKKQEDCGEVDLRVVSWFYSLKDATKIKHVKAVIYF